LLFGNSFHNRIRGNAIRGSRATAHSNHFVSDTSVTGANGRGPTGWNLWKDNIINDSTGSDLLLFHNYCCSDCGGAGHALYNNYGNTAVDNTIVDGDFRINYQYYFDQGMQAPDTTNAADSPCTTATPFATDEGTPTLDITDWDCTDYGLICVESEGSYGKVSDLDDTCAGAAVCAAAGTPIATIKGLNISMIGKED
jgi:hypothetical protein